MRQPACRRVAVAAGLSLALLWAPNTSADPLLPPEGAVVLTVSGRVDRTTDGHSAYFDRAMLERLGTVTIETSAPWTDGADRYEGVLARNVLKAVGTKGPAVVASALNGYVAKIPVADFERHDVIFALKSDGAYLTPRDKGPLFVVYPFDHNPELRTEAIYSRSIWQMTEIEIE